MTAALLILAIAAACGPEWGPEWGPDTRVCADGLLIIEPQTHQTVQVWGSAVYTGPHRWQPFGDPALLPHPWGDPPVGMVRLGSRVLISPGSRVVHRYESPAGVATYVYEFLGAGPADFDGDGDLGTDADIEAFFACLADPACRAADFDCDGDSGTDLDIAAFFRCLSGGCP
jgi:hypothetical protein